MQEINEDLVRSTKGTPPPMKMNKIACNAVAAAAALVTLIAGGATAAVANADDCGYEAAVVPAITTTATDTVSADDSGVMEWHTVSKKDHYQNQITAYDYAVSYKWGIDANGTLWFEPADGTAEATIGKVVADSLSGYPAWSKAASSIKSVNSKGTIRVVAQAAGMFRGLSNFDDSDFARVAQWDWSDARDMTRTFSGTGLENPDFSALNLDGTKLEWLSFTFADCPKLKQVQNMGSFNWTLNASNASTKTAARFLFQNDPSLLVADLSFVTNGGVAGALDDTQVRKLIIGPETKLWDTSPRRSGQTVWQVGDSPVMENERPLTTAPYTGKWTTEDASKAATSEELQDEWTSDTNPYAGTWLWQVAKMCPTPDPSDKPNTPDTPSKPTQPGTNTTGTNATSGKTAGTASSAAKTDAKAAVAGELATTGADVALIALGATLLLATGIAVITLVRKRS